MEVALKDLKLGDTVRLNCGAFTDALVSQINHDGTVVVSRPYVGAPTFSYGAPPRVIVMTGMETLTLHGPSVERVATSCLREG